ncbi:MAG TPA: hypothetical protein VNB49_00620 [Candidatus Dormibacteraeota bacterium]|nr:hypothetical protein [Candidatus Dormibacteraeota bacterium]
MIYRLQKYDVEIICTDLDQDHPKVVVSLGSEVRTFQLKGFIDFWLDVIHAQRKALDRYFELIASANSKGGKRRPPACGLKRHGVKIRFIHLNHVRPEVVLTLGSEVRTLQLEEFIELGEEMKKFLPKAAAMRMRYLDKLEWQRELGSVNTRPSRESVREGRDAQKPVVPDGVAGIFKPETTGPIWLIYPDVRTAYTDAGVVVIGVLTNVCCSLNNIASQIWLAMRLSPWGITVEGIVGVLEDDEMIPPELSASEVAECLDTLQRMGLVRCEGDSAFKRVGA